MLTLIKSQRGNIDDDGQEEDHVHDKQATNERSHALAKAHFQVLVARADFQRGKHGQVDVRYDEAHEDDRDDNQPVLRAKVVNLRGCTQDRDTGYVTGW